MLNNKFALLGFAPVVLGFACAPTSPIKGLRSVLSGLDATDNHELRTNMPSFCSFCQVWLKLASFGCSLSNQRFETSPWYGLRMFIWLLWAFRLCFAQSLNSLNCPTSPIKGLRARCPFDTASRALRTTSPHFARFAKSG